LIPRAAALRLHQPLEPSTRANVPPCVLMPRFCRMLYGYTCVVFFATFLCASFSIKGVPARTFVVDQGAAGDQFFVVLEGQFRYSYDGIEVRDRSFLRQRLGARLVFLVFFTGRRVFCFLFVECISFRPHTCFFCVRAVYLCVCVCLGFFCLLAPTLRGLFFRWASTSPETFSAS